MTILAHPPNCGIYKITNLATGDFYIGQSADLRKRARGHFNQLEKNKHPSLHIQGAYQKYGRENFVFQILLYCELFELDRYEQSLVDSLKPRYNHRLKCVVSNRGVACSEETRRKLSKAGRGRIVTVETRAKISEAKKGRLSSEEHRARLSTAHVGQPSWNKGKKASEDAIRKNKEGHKGQQWSEEARRKLSKTNKGRPSKNKGRSLSKETRRKMSEAHKLKSYSNAPEVQS